jgi:protein-S-isoprenylcysteine O-methyltransferase Ste14
MVHPLQKTKFIIIYLPNLGFFIILTAAVFATQTSSLSWLLLNQPLNSPLRIFELSMGQFLTVFACIFIVWGVTSLGLNRAEGKELTKPKENSPPITKGAYAVCRHPITFGFILIIVGFALTFDFIPLFLTAASYPLLLFALLRYEEKELENRFGQAYLEYKKSTPIFPTSIKK